MNIDTSTMLAVAAGAFHLVGFLSAIQAIMTARTPQGSVAWAVVLVAFPYVSLPFYWLFGRGRFEGYSLARRDRDLKVQFLREQENTELTNSPSALTAYEIVVLEALAQMRFRIGNDVSLLIDGKATFDAIFEAIDSAKEYLLVQFYIVREDELGTLFKNKLLAAAARGVRIYFLYDQVGSRLSKAYLKELREASIEIRPFANMKGPKNRFQLNFRNHRKTVVADGKVAYLGGLNVGDDYLGKDPKIGFWRDTHVEVRGPAAAQVQVTFMEDWYWSSDTLPSIKWYLEPVTMPGKAVLTLPSGPADPLDTFTLFLLEAIHSAEKRIWIASPYFVPDIQILSALQLAALRGAEIRILLPAKNDNLLCHLASYSYLKDLLPWNIAVYHYEKGFLHQKVILIDDMLSSVGTANFDNRSFRLNFEITLLVSDRDFASSVEKMLEDDFTHSRPLSLADFNDRSFLFRLAVQSARLCAPIL